MSGDKVTLPSGAWVEFRDPEDVWEKPRRRVRNMIFGLSPDTKRMLAGIGNPAEADAEAQIEMFVAASATDAALLDQINDAMAVALIASWSREEPPTEENIAETSGPDYEALQVALAPYVGVFMGLDTTASRDPDSPS